MLRDALAMFARLGLKRRPRDVERLLVAPSDSSVRRRRLASSRAAALSLGIDSTRSVDAMIWFWLGFFALVALLLFLDLGVLHRGDASRRSELGARWTIGWVAPRPVVRRRRLPDLREPLARRAAVATARRHTCDRRRRGDHVRLGVPARAGAVDRQHLRDVAAVPQLPRAGEVPAPRPVLGNPRRDRVPRRDARRRRVPRQASSTWIFYIFGGYLAWQGVKLLRAATTTTTTTAREEPRGPHPAPVRPHRRRRPRRQVHGPRSTAGAR